MAEASKAVAEKKATEVAAFDFAQLQKMRERETRTSVKTILPYRL